MIVMPYKARPREGTERKREKSGYRVTNWSGYNLSLKKRGQISLYFPAGELKSQFINPSPWTTGVSGRAPEYYIAYIELIYTFYRVFGWGMRQISGYMEDYWKTVGLDIRVPSFGHLSDRFSNLNITVKQRCDRLARQLANGKKCDDGRRWYGPEFRSSQPVV